MNEHTLINYGIVRSFHDNQKSILDTLLPIIEFGLSQISKKEKGYHNDINTLQRFIKDNTGVFLTILTIKNLLKKLENKGVIQLYQKNQYFRLTEGEKLEEKDYLESFQSFQRRLNKFLASYKEYSNDTRSEEIIKQDLYDFLRLKETKREALLDENNPSSAQYKKFFAFIQWINQQDDELYTIFKELNFGYTVCSLLERDKGIDSIKLYDFVIYIDSTFVLRLIDLQEYCSSKETKELFDLLIASGATIKILDETISEVTSIIGYYKELYVKKKEEYERLFEPSQIEGVLGAFFRRHLTVSQIEDIIDNLEETLKSIGIQVDQARRYGFKPNEQEIKKLLEKRNLPAENDEAFYYKQCQNYIMSFQIISWQRQNNHIRPQCFGNSKFLLLTCDWNIYRFNAGNKSANGYPEVITQESIVDNLMLFYPEKYEGISTDLIVSIFLRTKYLKTEALEGLAENIKTIIRDDPQMTRYATRASKNIDLYSDLSALYTTESTDSMDILMQLIDAEQQKESEQQKQQEERIAKSFNEGKIAGQEYGLAEGYKSGKIEGFKEGREKGQQEGIEEGKKQGHQKGIEEGKKQGHQEGVKEGKDNALTALTQSKIAFRKKMLMCGLVLYIIAGITLIVLIACGVIRLHIQIEPWAQSVILFIAGSVLGAIGTFVTWTKTAILDEKKIFEHLKKKVQKNEQQETSKK